MIDIARVIVVVAGLWLIAVGWLMAVHPRRALEILALTASSHRANLSEQIPRMIAGAALVTSAGVSRAPTLFHLGGWFVVATSIALIIIPLKWHAGYAIWWSKRLQPSWVKLVAPVSMLFGGLVIYAVVGVQ